MLLFSTRTYFRAQWSNESFRRLTNDFNGAGVDSLAEPVHRLAHVGASVLGISIEDIQSNISKVVGGPEAVTSLDGLAIDKPLDPQVGIVDGLEPALQVDPGLLGNSLSIVERRRENGLGQRGVTLYVLGSLPLLQVPQLVQPIPVQGVKEQTSLGTDLEVAAGGRLTHDVGGVAGVGATVLSVSVEDVKSDKAEVVGGSEPVTLRNGLAVAKPLNLRSRNTLGCQGE